MQQLERLSFGGSDINVTLLAQSRILLFWYCTTYLLLEKNKPKYQQLEPPSIDQIKPSPQLEPLENDPQAEDQQLESSPLDQGKANQEYESPPPVQLNLFDLEGF